MPQNLTAQFVYPRPKVLNFNEKRLRWASIVRAQKYTLSIYRIHIDVRLESINGHWNQIAMTFHFSCNFVLIVISWITLASSKSRSKTLESLSPVEEFNILKPDEDNGQEKISAAFKASINSPDTLDTFLNVRFMSYLKCSNWRRISKLALNFGCSFTFCYLNGANSIKTNLHIGQLCKSQVSNLVFDKFAQAK